MYINSLFEPKSLGPLMLRNGFIRSAAFEGMSPGHLVSQELINYHTAVAKGGVAMTTVAYASVSKSGLSFPHQLWLHDEAIEGLRHLTKSVHEHGALASIQIGHCGNMGSKKVSGLQPIGPTSRVNIYGPTFPRKMEEIDFREITEDFANGVKIAAKSGFDAVEIHAGHGYLISQFLSPYTNRRNDKYGGSFENRTRFLKEVLQSVKSALPDHMALIVKMNSWDGFESGITKEEALKTAKIVQEYGADAIVVSGGFVSRAPMYVMRGKIPSKPMTYYMSDPIKSGLIKLFGDLLIKKEPYTEGFFLEDTLRIQNELNISVIAVGGMNSTKTLEYASSRGIQFVAMARALIEDPDFINKLKSGRSTQSECTLCNFCVAKMYSSTMSCHLHDTSVPEHLKADLEDLRNS